MKYTLLGRTGIKVSELCLGTMTFGREATEAESRAMMEIFAEAGGNFIDTADVYSRGESEKIVGRWLAGQERERFVVATKVRYPMGEGPNETGLSRTHILAGIEGSLARLGLEYIDLYQIHGWDPLTPMHTILRTLNDLVRRGLVRHIGVSNVKGWQLQYALDLARELDLEPFVSLQPQYNLLSRATEWELLDVCRENGLAVIPWSPLRGGWLSGRYTRGMEAPPPDSRIAVAEVHGWGERWSNYNNEFTWSLLDELFAVAKECGKTPAQVALNWVMQNPVITAPIVGARTSAQLRENLGAVGWNLTPDQKVRLDATSEPMVSYPYDASARWQRERE